ncbi:MAG: SH3 domain-containing protein, partial [Chloroflexota bacterium]|nr:SH3 domain-containing protein [Chloroflexota bacterium]
LPARPAATAVTRRALLAFGAAAAIAVATVPLAAAQENTGEESAALLASPFRTTADLNLRAGPGTSYRMLLVIPSGAMVTGGDQLKNGFRQVSYAGTLGWASDQYLTVTNGGSFDPGPVVGTRVTSTDLNFRTGPTQLHDVIRVLPAGTTVEITDLVIDGFRFVYHEGRGGFAFDEYLVVIRDGGPPMEVPVTVLTPLNLRVEPNTGARVVLVMPGGAQVVWFGDSRNGFLLVAYGGYQGWAWAEYLRRNDAPSSAYAETTAALNLREQPNTGARVLLVMPAGAEVRLTDERSNGFRKVTYQSTTGWAFEQYLRML